MLAKPSRRPLLVPRPLAVASPGLLLPLLRVSLLVAALLLAVVPLAAADYEVGGNDVLVSLMGSAGQTVHDGIFATEPAAAYDPVNRRVLVVWSGVDSVGVGQEIWGQLLDAETGLSVGGDFQISSTGVGRQAVDPAVVFDTVREQYLVVWSSDDSALGEFEIYGQVIGPLGAELGFDDFRISSVGPPGDVDYDATRPDVVFNAVHDQYLVAWSSDQLTEGEEEIWAQPIGGSTSPHVLLYLPWQVTDWGVPGDTSYDMLNPDLVYQAKNDEYALVAEGRISGEPHVHSPQIFGRTLRGSDAEPLGDLLQISQMSRNSPGGEWLGYGSRPAVAHNPAKNEYFVVWQGMGWSNQPYESEIWGQRLGAPGLAPLDFVNERQLTDAAPALSASHGSGRPDVVYDPGSGTYFVVSYSDHLSDDEFEIRVLQVHWSGRLAPGVAASGWLLSDMGGFSAGSPNPDYDAFYPTLVHAGDRFFTAWMGDDDTAGLGDDEFEIFGQFFTTPGSVIHRDDFELGAVCFWTVVGDPSTPTCF